jgi:hypothetical protein
MNASNRSSEGKRLDLTEVFVLSNCTVSSYCMYSLSLLSLIFFTLLIN